MVKRIIHPGTRADYSLEFKKEKISMYGLELNEIDIFRCYGNLPDNNLAVNKLINALGTHLLDLEYQPSPKPYHQFECGLNTMSMDILANLLMLRSNS